MDLKPRAWARLVRWAAQHLRITTHYVAGLFDNDREMAIAREFLLFAAARL